MRLAVSNLAWPTDQETTAFSLLARLGAQGVEVAPTKLAAWDALPGALLAQYRIRLEAEGLVVSSLQAILFGRPELQLLGDTTTFGRLADHMRHVSDIAAILGASTLVFGSPRNRLLGEMSLENAWPLARERLRSMAEITAQAGVTIGVEPVPPAYGGDFMTSWRDVLRMVQEVDHSSLRVHLDTGCIALGGDSIGEAVHESDGWIGHFHAAQPHLATFSVPAPSHSQAASALQEIGYSRWLAIEMREQPDVLASLQDAVRHVRQIYIDV